MTLEQFIEKLYAAGWNSPCDAQHENIAKLWEELKEYGITAAMKTVTGITKEHKSDIFLESDIPSCPQGAYGIWSSSSSLGGYTIEWHDDDRVKVTKKWKEFSDIAILTGGDFETILETLFTAAVVTRVPH